MAQIDTAAIVGVGLIGGSIGLALRQRGLARTVVGIGRTPSRLRTAERVGAIDWGTSDIGRGVADAELIVVCTPVEHVVAHVRQAARACAPGALITDAGSTKGTICRALATELDGRGAFVGSHPMAGSEKSGPEHADPSLFDGCITVITPTPESRAEDVDRIEAFWRSLGASVLRMTPDEHDRVVANVSHLPHLVASALAASVDPRDLVLAATGWQSTTRVAAGDAELWRQIFSENRPQLLGALTRFEDMLHEFRRALEQNDLPELGRLLTLGKHNRDALAG